MPIRTVGELRQALAAFQDSQPIRGLFDTCLWEVDEVFPFLTRDAGNIAVIDIRGEQEAFLEIERDANKRLYW